MKLFSNKGSSTIPASTYRVETPAVFKVCSSGSLKLTEEPTFSKPLKSNQYFDYLASDSFLEVITGSCGNESESEDDIDLPMEEFHPDETEDSSILAA